MPFIFAKRNEYEQRQGVGHKILIPFFAETVIFIISHKGYR